MSYKPYSQQKKHLDNNQAMYFHACLYGLGVFLKLRNELPLSNMHLPRGRHHIIHGHMEKPMSTYNLV